MHDLHVWQLVDGMIIASVHVVCTENTNVNEILGKARYYIIPILSKKVRNVLHQHNIHSATIQPEFIQRSTTFVILQLASFDIV